MFPLLLVALVAALALSGKKPQVPVAQGPTPAPPPGPAVPTAAPPMAAMAPRPMPITPAAAGQPPLDAGIPADYAQAVQLAYTNETEPRALRAFAARLRDAKFPIAATLLEGRALTIAKAAQATYLAAHPSPPGKKTIPIHMRTSP